MFFTLFDQPIQLHIKSFSRALIHCYFLKWHVHLRHDDIEVMVWYFCSVTIAVLIHCTPPFTALVSFSNLPKQGLAHYDRTNFELMSRKPLESHGTEKRLSFPGNRLYPALNSTSIWCHENMKKHSFKGVAWKIKAASSGTPQRAVLG